MVRVVVDGGGETRHRDGPVHATPAGLFSLLLIDTKAAVNGSSNLNTSTGGGGGGGGGGTHSGVGAGRYATGGGAGAGGSSGGAAGGGGAGSGSQMSVAMSKKFADHGALIPVVPTGAVPGSRGADTTIPTPAINAAAAMRMPGRRYHREAASVSSAVQMPFACSSVFAAGGAPPPELLDRDSESGLAEADLDRSVGFDMSKVWLPGTTWS